MSDDFRGIKLLASNFYIKLTPGNAISVRLPNCVKIS